MRPSTSTAPLRRAILLAIALAVTGFAQESAQAPPAPSDPNGHPFRTPIISLHESALRLATVQVSRGDRDRLVLLAELGDQLGFWVRRDPDGDFELAAAVHARAASRFDLGESGNDFIEVHYRVGTFFRARYRALAARVEVFHISSHLGDEFLLETSREPISTSREGVELLIQGAPVHDLVLYGGPGVIFRSTLPFKTVSARFGAEWERGGMAFLRPYVGADGWIWSELDWDPQVVIEAGAALGRSARVGFTVGFGPSRAEQFFRESETVYGVSLSYSR